MQLSSLKTSSLKYNANDGIMKAKEMTNPKKTSFIIYEIVIAVSIIPGANEAKNLEKNSYVFPNLMSESSLYFFSRFS